MTNRLCFTMLFALVLCPLARAQDQASNKVSVPKVRVYLLAGQSNMAGVGQASELSPTWQAPIEGAMIYRGGDYQTVRAGDKGRFGPEVGFAHYMANNSPEPGLFGQAYLIKFALSGQPLDAGWDGGAADGSSWVSAEPGPNRKTFYPGTSPNDPNTGLHYKRMMTHVKAGMQALRDRGFKPVLAGIVWMQGEQDAKNKVSADRYDKSLALLKARIEEDLGAQPVPFVFGQVLPYEPAMDRFTHRDLIRQRMAEADHRSGSTRAIDDAWMVSTDGMDLNKDTVHYSTKGQLELGQALGVAMLTAQRKAAVDKKTVNE